MEGLGLGALCVVYFCLQAWASGLERPSVPEPDLICEEDHIQYTIPKSQIGDVAPKLSVLGKKGQMQTLENSSCGTWTELADGSIVIAATYEGCYVTQWRDQYMMVLDIFHKDDHGQWKIPERKELSCPIRPAMDAPSPSQCTAIQRPDRLLCGEMHSSQDVCQNEGCCYDQSDPNNACYFGNTVTVQCTQDGLFTVAISKDVTRPSLNLTTVTLPRTTDKTCSPKIKNNAFVLFQFPVSSCGTSVQTIGGEVVYENALLSQRTVQTWKGSSITRDSPFRLTVRCSMSSSAIHPLHVNVFTLAPPPGVTSYGPLNLEMRIAKDVLYSQYYNDVDYPIVKLLQDPVFVEVRILQHVDPQLVLMLQQCWATPAPSPFEQMQWPLLLNGCPFNGDNYLTLPIPIDRTSARLDFPSYYKRFDVTTFTFMDSTSQKPLSGQVYFHCSASVCVPSYLQNCAVTCSQRTKRSEHGSSSDLIFVSSSGPVNFLPDLKEALRGSRPAMRPLKMEYIAIAASIGVIGLLLAAFGIWRHSKVLHGFEPCVSLLTAPVAERLCNMRTSQCQ